MYCLSYKAYVYQLCVIRTIDFPPVQTPVNFISNSQQCTYYVLYIS